MVTILDPGSTHCGKKELAFELIDLAAKNKAEFIKFQLFTGSRNGNIELPRKYWQEIVDYAKGKIGIFASVFDEEAVIELYMSGCRWIKIAYSQAFNLKLLKRINMYKWDNIIASGDEKVFPYYANTKLYRPEGYPPQNDLLNADCLKKFDGLSSHYLGYNMDKKIMKLAKWDIIEKHITLDREIDCPDHYFALSPKQLEEFMCQI